MVVTWLDWMEHWLKWKRSFQSALQICTMGTELPGCANEAMAVLVIRFLKRKMGWGQHQPTIIYQEHQTAIQTMHNAGSISKAYGECQWTLEPSLYQQFSFGKLNDAICDWTIAPPPTDVGGGDQFEVQLREQLTRDVRAQHRAEHREVQEQRIGC